MIRTQFLPLIALATTVACSSMQPGIQGSGNLLLQERSVETFASIHVRGLATVELSQGEHVAVEVTADENLLPYLRSDVSEGVLTLGFESGSYEPSKTPHYRVQVVDLESLSTSGSVKVSGGSITAGEITFKLSGSSELDLESLQAQSAELVGSGSSQVDVGTWRSDSLNYKLSGSGRLDLGQGAIETLDASISGSGKVRMGAVKTTTAALHIRGSGKASVWATDTLDVKISGSGEVDYHGNPVLSSKISGSGSIRSVPE